MYKIVKHFRYFVQITLHFNSYNNVTVKLQVEKLKSYIFNQHYHNILNNNLKPIGIQITR